MPSYEAERQVINRTKKSIRPDYPSQPETLKDFIITDFLTQNLLNEPFLLHDSGVDDPERYLIFASMSNLKLLENNEVFADGTKKKASEFRNRPSVTLEDRIKAVTMREQGKTLETIGRELNRAISCIKRINYRYDETNSYKDRPRSGISTQKDDRNLIHLAKKNRTEPSHVLANQWKLSNGKTASSSLVRRRLLANKMIIEVDSRKNLIFIRRTSAERYNQDCIIQRT
ncbi:unnamed protein product [Brachionus calyciflorus]|uniref:Transposase IS30-like HTH domain-containing protein n=1 Tax=Brachionus calyciflorus TaxID=104777 RepID=A0A814M2R2_9BILA|nr:unnamed protein product [Brachionus calyciflorus]